MMLEGMMLFAAAEVSAGVDVTTVVGGLFATVLTTLTGIQTNAMTQLRDELAGLRREMAERMAPVERRLEALEDSAKSRTTGRRPTTRPRKTPAPVGVERRGR